MNGLVSYSDDEETEIDSFPGNQNKTMEKMQAANSSSSLGIKKTTSLFNSSTSSPSSASVQSKPQQVQVEAAFKSNSSYSSQFQSQYQSQHQKNDVASSSPSTSQTRLRALCFPPPKRLKTKHSVQDQEEDGFEEQEDRRWDHEWGLGLEAEGQVDEALQAKLSNFHSLKSQGTHFNPTLSSSRAFRNPHIYAKLVNFVEVDERRSCYLEESSLKRKSSNPNLSWNSMDPQILKEGAKERLAHLQKSQAEERQKAQEPGKRSQVEFTSSSSSSRRDHHSSSSSSKSEDQKKRDQSEAVKRALAARDSLGLKSQGRERDRDRDRDREKQKEKDQSRIKDRDRLVSTPG